MPKKFTYFMKGLTELFQEQIQIELPDLEDAVKKEQYMNDVERGEMWIRLLDKYGDDGWELVGTAPILVGTEYHYLFKKLAYTK
jgi:hypothetical protein